MTSLKESEGANLIVSHKININAKAMRDFRIGLVVVATTGSNNIDLHEVKRRGIAACNYAAEFVNQHAFYDNTAIC